MVTYKTGGKWHLTPKLLTKLKKMTPNTETEKQILRWGKLRLETRKKYDERGTHCCTSQSKMWSRESIDQARCDMEDLALVPCQMTWEAGYPNSGHTVLYGHHWVGIWLHNWLQCPRGKKEGLEETYPLYLDIRYKIVGCLNQLLYHDQGVQSQNVFNSLQTCLIYSHCHKICKIFAG